MKKFLKPGKLVVMLSGKYAGKKAVILKVFYEGSSDRKFGHLLVAGIHRAPRKVHKGMSDDRIEKRIRIKPFVKYVNFNHVMPTRYSIPAADFDYKVLVKSIDSSSTVKKEGEAEKKRDALANADFRIKIKKDIKKILEDKYKAVNLNNNDQSTLLLKFFFKKLRF